MARRLSLILTAGILAAMAPACSSPGGGAKKKAAPESTDTSTSTSSQNNGTSLPPCTTSSTSSGQSTAGGASAGGAIVNPNGTDLGSGTTTGTSTDGTTAVTTLALDDFEQDAGSGFDSGTGSSTSTSTGATTGAAGAAGAAYAALESVVQSKCASCHNGTIAPSDYTSEAGFDKDANTIAQRLNGQGAPMPPQGSQALTDTEKQAMLAYVGALTGATAAPATSSTPCASSGGTIGGTSTGGTTDTTGGSTDTTGGTMTNTGDPGQTTATTVSNSTLLQQTLQSADAQACNTGGHIYIRHSLTCSTLTLASTCTYASISAAIGAAGASTIQQYQAANKVPDQCGTDASGHFVAYFLCVLGADGTTCVPPAQYDTGKGSFSFPCIATAQGLCQ